MKMNAPLSTATSSGSLAGVVGGDLLAQLGDAVAERLGVDEDLADQVVVMRSGHAGRT